MNFIALTDKHARALENWKNGHGFSDQEALQDLANIWNEFHKIPERQKVIYSGALGTPPDVDPSCGNCSSVRDMLTMVINWRKILEHEVTVDFKGVPQAMVVTEGTEPKAEGLVKLDQMFDEFLTLSQMKMHQIRSIAKEKGINYTPSTKKEELIKLLSEKR